MYHLRQQAQAFIQDVLCGVYVPVVYSAARRTGSFSDRQILNCRILSAAGRKKLDGWEEAVNPDHLLSIP